MWNKFTDKPNPPAPYDGKPFLAKLLDGRIVPAAYTQQECSEYKNFYCIDDEGDYQYLNASNITRWKPIS